MKIVEMSLFIVFSVFSTLAFAENFGIRFVVDDASLNSPESQARMAKNLNRMVEELNLIYKDSEVDLTARIVDIQFSRMQDRNLVVILQEMQLKNGVFLDFISKATHYHADFTIAVVQGLQTKSYWKYSKGNICGAAHGSWSVQDMMSVEKAYAVINPSCSSSTLAHELGHIMGVNHGVAMTRCFPNKKESIPITSYGFGYSEGECNSKPSPEKFGDIMTGGLMLLINGNPSSIKIFSNPRIRRPECGVRGICGDPKTGDAARALNENARYFIKYHPTTRH
jgi:hypothetical protein